MFPKKECDHTVSVLKETLHALKQKDSQSLKSLSDKTIHSSCTFQDSGSITSAVLIYTLSKLVSRSDHKKIPSWDKLEKKCTSLIELAIKALEDNNHKAYETHILKARQTLENMSGDLKPYIKEVLRKSEINKASKLYEHGLSSEQTSKLLGITQWELSEYIGSKNLINKSGKSIKSRASMALKFFS